MKPPVDYVRINATGKDILSRVKRHTGIEHWNVLCRVAFCRSLANPQIPPRPNWTGESLIDMEWKTFAGPISDELSSSFIWRAKKDGIDLDKKEAINEYFKSHLERGVNSLQKIRTLDGLITR